METMSPRKSLLILGIVASILGAMHEFLFYNQGTGVNFFIMVFFIVVGGLVVARGYGKALDKQASFLIAPALFFAGMVFVRASELLTFFNLLGSVLLLLLIARTYTGKSLSDYLPVDYIKTFFIPIRFFVPFFRSIGDMAAALFGRFGSFGKDSRRREIARGVLMSVVAVAVFVALFAGADATFERFFTSVMSFDFGLNAETMSRLSFFAFATAVFVGSFSYAFRGQRTILSESRQEKARTFGSLEIMILLGSISVLFFLFIIFQLAHLFGGGNEIVSNGITYAEYARKGFFELILVAILSYLIIATAEKQIIKDGNSHKQSFRIVSTILIAQAIAILISAFMKLSLYESAYGFTTIRLYSHALMVWLAVIFVFLAHYILAGGARTSLASRSFVAVIVLLFAMNLINPDSFIAQKNSARYQTTGKIDALYLGTLSSDALPDTIHLLDDQNQAVRQEYAQGLRRMSLSRDEVSYSWQSFHLSRSKGETILASKKVFIEALVTAASPATPSFFINSSNNQ